MKLTSYLQAKLNETIIPEKRILYILKGFSNVGLELNVPKFGDINFSKLLSDRDREKPDISNLHGAYYLYYEEASLLSDLLSALSYINYDVKIVNCNIYNGVYPTFSDYINTAGVEDFYGEQHHVFQDIFSTMEYENGICYVTYNPISVQNTIEVIDLFELPSETFTPKKTDDWNSTDSIDISNHPTSFASLVDNILSEKSSSFFLETQEDLSPSILTRLCFLSKFADVTLHKIFPYPDYTVETQPNPAFLDILRRRNPSYNFKRFLCYKNPSINNDTVEINQEKVISKIVEQAERARSDQDYKDIFVTAPTGSGKSIMFQIPAIFLAEKYSGFLTIVISPLIGLMNDQVNNIEDLTSSAATINSDFTPEEKSKVFENIRNGKTNILYLSPESFLMNSDIATLIGEKSIGLFIIDEAHTVVTWGQSFRPDYWYLGERIKQLRTSGKMSFPIATFSATIPYGGTDNMYQDMIDSLNMETYETEFLGIVRRDEIQFSIKNYNSKVDYELEKRERAVKSLKELIDSRTKTIAYFPFKRTIGEIYRELDSNSTTIYHAGLHASAKRLSAYQFSIGEKHLLLATKAYGMGIDIPDIACVYHFAPTGTLCDYVQEIGRAARKPGSIGIARTDYFPNDFRYIKSLYGMSRIREYHIKGVLRKIQDVYLKHRQRNFTLSPDGFAHIFDKNLISEVESSLKATLLMIEKDFELGNYSYKPLIFRPRTFFTLGYVIIEDKDLSDLQNTPYFRYFSKFRTKQQMTSKVRNVEILYTGDLYQVNFKEIWENHFRNLSFANFKYQFYEGSLLGFAGTNKYIPHYLLNVQWSFDSAFLLIQWMNKLISVLGKTFAQLGKNNKYFSVDEFQKQVEKNWGENENDKIPVLEYEALLSKLVTIINNYDSGNLTAARPITTRDDTHYIKLPTKCAQFFRTIGAVIANQYQNTQGTQKSFIINARTNKEDLINKNRHFLGAQLLEILGLADYTIVSGERPEFFIRINNINAISAIVNDERYKSPMVERIAQRYNDGVLIMRHFFENLDTDRERWDYIEEYFNGRLEVPEE